MLWLCDHCDAPKGSCQCHPRILKLVPSPSVMPEVGFKLRPWNLSAKTLARIAEIERHHRWSWQQVMSGHFWLD